MADGITSEGFNIKRLPEIKSDLEAQVRVALNHDSILLPDSPEGQMIGIFSAIYAALWEQLEGSYSAFNPNDVTAQALDDLVQLNGLTRLVARPSTVTLTFTGLEGTVIPADSIISHNLTGAQFLTDADATIPAALTIDVTARSKEFGSIVAEANSLTVIETPVNGWDTSDNVTAAITGRLLETDAELRVRRSRSLALAGQSSLGSIFAAVAAIDGVSHVSAIENVTDVTSAEGLPPHSFSVVVQGGQDADIGQTIWLKKPAGIRSFGSTTVQVTDIQNVIHDIEFQRPVTVPIYVRANITFFVSPVPDNAADLMAQGIIDYAEGKMVAGAGFSVGDDVVHSRLYTPLNLTLQGHTVNSLEISYNGVDWVVTDLPIDFNEVSNFDLTRIDLTVG